MVGPHSSKFRVITTIYFECPNIQEIYGMLLVFMQQMRDGVDGHFASYFSLSLVLPFPSLPVYGWTYHSNLIAKERKTIRSDF